MVRIDYPNLEEYSIICIFFKFLYFNLLVHGQVDFNEEDSFYLLQAKSIRPYIKHLFLPIDRLVIYSLNLL